MQFKKFAEGILINISSYINITYLRAFGRYLAPLRLSRYHSNGWLVLIGVCPELWLMSNMDRSSWRGMI